MCALPLVTVNSAGETRCKEAVARLVWKIEASAFVELK